MTKTQGSNLICIRSRDLDNTNTLGNSGRLVLQQAIESNPNEKLYVCVLSATFPNSWYNLSLHLANNTISFKETGDSSYKLITIEDGTYNIDELCAVELFFPCSIYIQLINLLPNLLFQNEPFDLHFEMLFQYLLLILLFDLIPYKTVLEVYM